MGGRRLRRPALPPRPGLGLVRRPPARGGDERRPANRRAAVRYRAARHAYRAAREAANANRVNLDCWDACTSAGEAWDAAWRDLDAAAARFLGEAHDPDEPAPGGC